MLEYLWKIRKTPTGLSAIVFVAVAMYAIIKVGREDKDMLMLLCAIIYFLITCFSVMITCLMYLEPGIAIIQGVCGFLL